MNNHLSDILINFVSSHKNPVGWIGFLKKEKFIKL